jgi:hypothetical protein
MTIAIVLLGMLVVRGERDETQNVSAPARTGAWAKRIGVPVPMQVPMFAPTEVAHTQLVRLDGNDWAWCGCQGCGCCDAATLCFR